MTFLKLQYIGKRNKFYHSKLAENHFFFFEKNISLYVFKKFSNHIPKIVHSMQSENDFPELQATSCRP